MYSYIKGKVVDRNATHICLESNNIGYAIKTANPYVFQLTENCLVYTYLHVREDIQELYGFRTNEEKELFIKLISVKGIGPKGALAVLATGSISGIVSAIESANSDYLRKFPGIGPKASQQIILDLKGKFKDTLIATNNDVLDVQEVLVSLGYSRKEINKVLPKLSFDEHTLDELIKLSLQLLLK